MEKNKVRNSNLEILRIVSMLLIIMHHYVVHGQFELNNTIISSNKIILEIISLGGKLGVNCFILITGYFMINSKISFKKILKIIFEVWFYSICIFLVASLTQIIDFDIKLLIKVMIPIIFNSNWFALVYIVLYIFIPYINMLINNLDKKQHFKLCLIFVCIFSIIPTFTTANIEYSNITWFVMLYCIAAYIRKYPNKYTENVKENILYTCIIIAFLIFSVAEFNILGLFIPQIAKHITYFGKINSFPLLILSVTMFLVFKNIKVKNNKFVNLIATSTFGVYLIHDNMFMRNYLWVKVLKNNTYIESPYLILHLIFSTIAVFIVCTLIDQIRIHIIENKIVDKLIDKMYNFYCKIKLKKVDKIKEIQKDDEKIPELK